MNAARAFSRVVLPDPVPPLIRMLRRSATAASSRTASSGEIVPSATSRSGSGREAGNLRIETAGPSTASGGMTTLTVDPSGKPGVGHRAELVHPPSERGENALDRISKLFLVGEADLRLARFARTAPRRPRRSH